MEASVETEDAEDDEDYEEEADGDEGDDDLLTVVKKEKLQQEEREKQLLQKLEILENAKGRPISYYLGRGKIYQMNINGTMSKGF